MLFSNSAVYIFDTLNVNIMNILFLSHSFSIDKNNETQVFIIDMAIEFADFFDEELRIANGLEVPMPLCNQDLDFLSKH